MPTLVLMRHANAELASPGMRDFDRPLSMAGREEATFSAHLLAKMKLSPTKLFCSPARRTMQTLECIRTVLTIDDTAIGYVHELYSGDVPEYQSTLNAMVAGGVYMLIGHNPMIERFAFELAISGDANGLHLLKSGFPTAALAIFDLDKELAKGSLISFLTPTG